MRTRQIVVRNKMSNMIWGMSNGMINLWNQIAMIVIEVLGRSKGSSGFSNVRDHINSRLWMIRRNVISWRRGMKWLRRVLWASAFEVVSQGTRSNWTDKSWGENNDGDGNTRSGKGSSTWSSSTTVWKGNISSWNASLDIKNWFDETSNSL